MSNVNEALLEMYYLRAFVDAFESVYGSKFLNLFKPSQQQEAMLGFDQAWVKTDLTDKEFYNHISMGGRNIGGQNRFYVGYFMQFKVVEQLRAIKRNPPNKVTVPRHFTTPYYRSELKTEPSPTQTISQHLMLYELSNNVENALVYYICPMLFDAKDIYQYPDLEKVQVIDVKNAPDPSTWHRGERHFIMFQDETGSDMTWCSEPIKGKSQSFPDWLESDLRPNKLTSVEVIKLLEDVRSFSKSKSIEEIFTILEFKS